MFSSGKYKCPCYYCILICQFNSVQSCLTLWDPKDDSTPGTRLPCPSPTPGACSNSCPLSWWCHPTISSSLIPFYSCLQSFPASGSFPMSRLFTPGGHSIGASTSASVLLMNIQGWLPLGSTGLILQFKELSRVFSSTIIQKHLFFSSHTSLLFSHSKSHICTWRLEKP